MNLNLVIFCVVLSQAIIGTTSSQNISESSGLLVRNKRVLNFEPGEDVPVRPGEFPYVVNIKLNNRNHCVGSIISRLTVITAAYCASENISEYQILFGSIYTFRGTARSVVEKKIRFGSYVGGRASDGIALFIVNEPFTARYSGIIRLHTGPVVPGVHSTVVGWGCYYVLTQRGTEHPRALRSITVPVMLHQQCVNTFRGIYDIIDEDICIYDQEKHCGNTDVGAPLIILGQLAGVHVRGVQRHVRFSGYRDPEIFVLLDHPHYREWIRDNTVHRFVHE